MIKKIWVNEDDCIDGKSTYLLKPKSRIYKHIKYLLDGGAESIHADCGDAYFIYSYNKDLKNGK